MIATLPARRTWKDDITSERTTEVKMRHQFEEVDKPDCGPGKFGIIFFFKDPGKEGQYIICNVAPSFRLSGSQ